MVKVENMVEQEARVGKSQFQDRSQPVMQKEKLN